MDRDTIISTLRILPFLLAVGAFAVAWPHQKTGNRVHGRRLAVAGALMTLSVGAFIASMVLR